MLRSLVAAGLLLLAWNAGPAPALQDKSKTPAPKGEAPKPLPKAIKEPPPGQTQRYSIPGEVGNPVEVEIRSTLVGPTGINLWYGLTDGCQNQNSSSKHFEHRACDASCNTMCSTQHEFAWDPGMSDTGGGSDTARPMEGAVNQALKGIGAAPIPLDARSVLFENLDRITRNKEYAVPRERVRHWNQDLCTVVDRTYLLLNYEYRYEVRAVRLTPRPDGTRARVEGPWIKVAVPQHFVMPTREFDEFRVVLCQCQVVKPTDEVGALPQGMVGPGVFVAQGQAPLDADEMKQCGLAVQGKSLNELLVVRDGPTGGTRTIVVGTAVEWTPDNPNFQRMMSVGQVKVTLEAAEGLHAGIRPQVRLGGPGSAPKDVLPVVCLEMGKTPPEARVRYQPGLPSDPALISLARAVAADPQKGPWHQVMFWYYTDRATLSEIQARLVPPPPAAWCLRGLHDMVRKTQTNLQTPERRRSLEPELLSGVTATQVQLSWLVGELAQADRASLVAYLKSEGFKAVFREAAQREAVARHAARVAQALAQAADAEVRLLAAEFLTDTVPVEARPKVAAEGGLSRPVLWLKSGAASEVEAAFKLIGEYRYRPGLMALATLARTTESAEYRAQAEALVRTLLAPPSASSR